MSKTDAEYLEVFLAPLRVCANYQPAFGTSGGVGLSLGDFKELYGADEFYSWIGLDSPLIYAAHRASGGLTSIYRQVGIASERLLREIIKDSLGLDEHQVEWRYEYNRTSRQKAFHVLDARITVDDVTSDDSASRLQSWLVHALKNAGGDKRLNVRGAIFEIRQGYKSADSKRQNADLRFGAKAYQAAHLPVVAVLSSQVSETVISRYRDAGMLVMTGTPSNDATVSTFAFFKTVVGYDLAGFFARASSAIQKEVHGLVEKLLSTR